MRCFKEEIATIGDSKIYKVQLEQTQGPEGFESKTTTGSTPAKALHSMFVDVVKDCVLCRGLSTVC
jgi:hypothetical protein